MDERTAVKLEPGQEWRFEVAFDAKVNVRLVDGSAELFGTELARGREYEFSGKHAAIFTYQGCELEWEGPCAEYVASNAVMRRYASIHFALEGMRMKSEKDGEQPPVTLILGDANAGKTTLAKVLVSYATKMGRFPMFVNLDPTQPAFSPPGSIAAVPVSHVLDIEDPSFGMGTINGPAQTHHKQPIVFDYGLAQTSQSPEFYQTLVGHLSEVVQARVAQDDRVRHSGIIIDTPTSMSSDEDSLLLDVISKFHVTSVLVVGKERLAVQLQRKLAPSGPIVVNVPQSGGVTDDDDTFLRQVQRRAITEYFFGSHRQALSPFTITTSLKELAVFRPLEQNDMTEGALLTKVEPSAVLQNCVLAFVNASPSQPLDEIARAETLGFVQVTEADDTKQLAKVLMTAAGSLPKKAFIMGSYRYHE